MDSVAFEALAVYEAKGPLKNFTYNPRPLQENDVDVEIEFCGVCHSDVHAIENDWMNSKYPLVPGHEIIGKITQLGSFAVNLPDLKIGTRVGIGPISQTCTKCADCKAGNEQLCEKLVNIYNAKDLFGFPTYGGFAKKVRVDARWVFPIPDTIPSEYAAPLLCAGITVFSPLRKWTKSGDKVGIVGIGGLGHLALQFSKALKCQTVAISSSASKQEEAKSFGADEFICSNDRNSMAKHRRSFQFILVCVSAPLPWAHYLSLLATDGRICLVGLPNGLVDIHPGQLIAKRVSVCGSPLGSIKEYHEMFQIATQHNVRPKIELYNMNKANDAVVRVRENKARFRCVLKAKL